MDRREAMLGGITKEMVGIEIGPWNNPLVPKQAGYKALVMDIFDTEHLRGIARGNPFMNDDDIKRIEKVDIQSAADEIGAAVEAKGVAGKIEYIVSSHNFEHLPDPIKFLQGCAKALKPGGVLVMALPDRRGVFDYFRPWSTTADVIAAFHEKRTKPTAKQRLEQDLLHARKMVDLKELAHWDRLDHSPDIYSLADIDGAYAAYLETIAQEDPPYIDVHCWQFTPASFELIMRDLCWLGLSDMHVEWVSDTAMYEFFVCLRFSPGRGREWSSTFYQRRQRLLRRTLNENSAIISP